PAIALIDLDGDLATGMETRLLAGNGGERRLGERAQDAAALERLDRGCHRGAVIRDADFAVGGTHDAGEGADREIAKIEVVEVPVDAELLDGAALDLGDRHLQVDLILAFDGEQIDDAAGADLAFRADLSGLAVLPAISEHRCDILGA